MRLPIRLLVRLSGIKARVRLRLLRQHGVSKSAAAQDQSNNQQEACQQPVVLTEAVGIGVVLATGVRVDNAPVLIVEHQFLNFVRVVDGGAVGIQRRIERAGVGTRYKAHRICFVDIA